MQIVGHLKVMNISEYDAFVMGAKLRKPKALGHAWGCTPNPSMYHPEYRIPEGNVSNLCFDFLIQPPVCDRGKPFKANVAIIDQFGNEHWLKGLEFRYVGPSDRSDAETGKQCP